jgi:hypothetical protein
MQNLKSLNNLIQKPVLGANDDTLAMVGRRKLDIYSYEEETRQMLMKIEEPQRSLLTKQLLTDSFQS